MKELQVVAWCDSCHERTGSRTAGTTSEPLLIVQHDGRKLRAVDEQPRRTLDLCEACADELLTKLAHLLDERGRASTPDVLAPTEPLALPGREPMQLTTTPARSEPGEGSWTCPVCDQVLRHKTGAIGHVWAIHRGQPRPTLTTCPDCGKEFERPASCGSHRAIVHDWDALGEALAGVTL